MTLQMIHRSPPGAGSKVPLLLVHGAFHGAWCWGHWIEWFASRGREVAALSLRGHAGSSGRESLHDFGLEDYRDDVLEAARDIGRPKVGRRPVLVGHSMGGAVAQLAASADPTLFSGVVLLASLPPDAFRFREFLSLLFDFPSRRTTRKLMAGKSITPEEIVSFNLFKGRISMREAERYSPLLQPESRKATREMLTFSAPSALALPALVMGSASDAIFGRPALERTARHFGADLAVLEHGCHDVMLDPARNEYSARLDSWLTSKDL